jgi:predicted DNA-binding protein
MLAYDDKKTTPLVTSSLNTFVQALKKAQDGRHALGGEEVPVQLLERMEREGLNPAVYTMESLERGVEEVEAVAVRDEMLEEIKKGIEEGMKRRKEGGKEGGKEEGTAMDVEES